MSRWFCYTSQKVTHEEMHRVDVRFLKKQGYLAEKNQIITTMLSWSNNVGENTGSVGIEVRDEQLILKYTSTDSDGNKESIEEKVTISKQPCHYGGVRKYLICPGCRRRVIVLYGGKYFRCRHCYNFCYSSQLEKPAFRLSRKARKLADKVAGDDKDYEGFPRRQPHKHREKYQRQRQEHDRILRASWSYVAHLAPDMDYPF